MDSKVNKRYRAWRWIIAGVMIAIVFAAGCLAGAAIYEFNGNGITKFKKYVSVIYKRDFTRDTVNMLENYDIDLPETAEFVMGYDIVDRDPCRKILFTINESDSDSLLGDTWSLVDENLEDTDIVTHYFGLYPYRGVMDNQKWQFDKHMKCSLHPKMQIYISKPIDGKEAVVFLYGL